MAERDAAPVIDEREARLAINSLHDVTHQMQTMQTWRFLGEVSDLLAQSLDCKTTLQQVASLVVARLADWCSIDIRDSDGSIHRLAMMHRDAGKLALAEEFQRHYPVQPDDPYGIAEVLRTGEMQYVSTVTDSMLQAIARDNEHLRRLRELGVQSVIIVPLIARDRTLGTLAVATAESGRHFGRGDVALAEEVARRAAFAVDNARLYHQPQQAEVALQRSHDRLHILHELDQAILAARSPEAMAIAALQHVRRLVACDHASVTLFDETYQEATILAVCVDGATQLERGDQLSLVGLGYLPALHCGEVYVEEDLLQSTSRPSWLQLLAQEGIRTLAHIPLLTEQTLIGTLNLGSKRLASFTAEHLDIAVEVANQIAIALAQARLVEQVQIGNQRLHHLSRRLMEVQELERRYMVRELHDEIGQALTGMKLLLESSIRDAPDGTLRQLQHARSLTQELMERVHQLSLDLRPGMLDDLGLLPALLWHFERYTFQTNVRVIFHHRGLERRFAPALETAVYRIIQEALTNIARHAQVSEGEVWICADQVHLRVEIIDHGQGFNPQKMQADKSSSGVTGMQERATLLHGSFTIDSDEGRGTTVTAVFPIHAVNSTEKERTS